MTSPPVLLVAVILSLIAVACGPRLRTCGDDVSDCGEGAYCDERSGVCILLLPDGGKFVEPSDAGPTSAAPSCFRGDTRPCAPGCGAVETCTAAGEWGACSAPTCGAGTACVNDRCVCSPATCAGCCLGGSECRPGTERYACGNSGGTCEGCGYRQCVAPDGQRHCS